MRYLFWGVMSLLLLSCTAAPIGVCPLDGNSEVHRVVKTKTRLEAQTRNATIKVVTYKDDAIAMGTGTIYNYKGYNIVITAAHVLGESPYLAAVLSDTDYVMSSLVYLDREADIAVLAVPELIGAKPMQLKRRRTEVKIGENTIYTGFPNDDIELTIRGYISAIRSDGALYLHSYAWPGASGSSVFDTQGRLLGVLSAIGVGTGIVGVPTAIEDVVLVVPITDLNFELLDLNLKSLDY